LYLSVVSGQVSDLPSEARLHVRYRDETAAHPVNRYQHIANSLNVRKWQVEELPHKA
jgi:hypothetical protein